MNFGCNGLIRVFALQPPSSFLLPHPGLHRTHKGDREDVGPLTVQGLGGHPAPEFLLAQDRRSRLAVWYVLNLTVQEAPLQRGQVTSEVSSFMTFRLAGVRDPQHREWLFFEVPCDRSVTE